MAPAAAAGGAFELEGVAFAIGGRPLLSPVTATFRHGQVTGLIGHNGSGKSTLLKLLARQQRATHGVVRLGGEPIDALGARAFARSVAYLPQQPPAAVGLTVRELVALGRYPWHGALGRFRAADAAAVAEAMELADVSAFADRMVEELSGGERQRVWLAMLVAQEARWLLLDEPTSALDVGHQLETLALIRRLVETRGLGAVVVLHDVNMAARYCDVLVALHGGRLIEEGAPRRIMTQDRLRAIYGVEMEILDRPDGRPPFAIAL